MEYLGELAALSTSVLWSFTSIFFTEAGKLVGSYRVNKIRLLFALTLYALILTLFYGSPVPQGITISQIGILILSGYIGLVLGDGFLFKSLVLIGPRLTTLVYATAPIWALGIGALLLDENISAIDLVGMALTLAGVGWVVLSRDEHEVKPLPTQKLAVNRRQGVILALSAAFCQGAGLVLAKIAMTSLTPALPPLGAAFIRIASAVAIIWLVALFRREAGDGIAALRNRAAVLWMSGGALMGPFLGVWMSLEAVERIPAGIAATLGALTPILILPVVQVIYKERVTLRAYAGAILAVGGVMVLFLA